MALADHPRCTARPQGIHLGCEIQDREYRPRCPTGSPIGSFRPSGRPRSLISAKSISTPSGRFDDPCRRLCQTQHTAGLPSMRPVEARFFGRGLEQRRARLDAFGAEPPGEATRRPACRSARTGPNRQLYPRRMASSMAATSSPYSPAPGWPRKLRVFDITRQPYCAGPMVRHIRQHGAETASCLPAATALELGTFGFARTHRLERSTASFIFSLAAFGIAAGRNPPLPLRPV